jgi:hypothetical protein
MDPVWGGEGDMDSLIFLWKPQRGLDDGGFLSLDDTAAGLVLGS